MRMYGFMFPVLPTMAAIESLTAKSFDRGGFNIRFPEISQVEVGDAFWKPKLDLWQKVTVDDVFDEFKGKHLEHPRKLCNTFGNFGHIAKGERNTGQRAGAPWSDGLVYETIHGVTDLMTRQSNVVLEKRADGYIDRITKAQALEPNGYVDTYT